ncbi:hypothetical protein BLA24064_00401 [Burkholderia latens]|uniref:Uncharacterized protein n=1 Tax=Burkholderia latens TaxID=488446 RepID=A0A6P2H7D3_9BURK|nr:hypothetical protein BLA24064_00401 [Burkholderia latens]
MKFVYCGPFSRTDCVSYLMARSVGFRNISGYVFYGRIGPLVVDDELPKLAFEREINESNSAAK